jgi:2-iminoacetate synthase
MSGGKSADWLDESKIAASLASAQSVEAGQIREILAKSLEMKGLDARDVAALCSVESPELAAELFEAARRVKEDIYGNRLVLFAPLYISNLCSNECLYCAFRASNKQLARRTLSQEEIVRETEILIRQGQKRVLLVAGESYPEEGFDYVLKSIETIYSVKSGHGEIRRINANVAPLDVETFKELKAAGIGTYQCFQETYHRETYARMHKSGRKRDFDWRATVFDRAMEAGIDDVGMGVLFGLADWKFEVLAMMDTIAHMEKTFGFGCHTISVPRMEPALGSDVAAAPPHPVSDADFMKLVAILRLAVPYTGIIMSTRESADIRRATFDMGVSQISAGSRTNPGGYCDNEVAESQQFQLGDHRSLEEVVRDVAELGFVPSFCTACYRTGRTGKDFMDLAKPGLIKRKCAPNALASFEEYLLDYAGEATKTSGARVISKELEDMDPAVGKLARGLIDKVDQGRRDVFC